MTTCAGYDTLPSLLWSTATVCGQAEPVVRELLGHWGALRLEHLRRGAYVIGSPSAAVRAARERAAATA
ncbi:hypothetical protein SAZ11_02595 [Streptomyces sp. FXJ1.4098]|uniref:hypothetical protein n=1 Tax=Streptomyces sp. NPDC020845 TaxID=3365096 RepID=UPI002999B76E|nr:hypothetical protein [Streptomyces sp. FXJ1.4098]